MVNKILNKLKQSNSQIGPLKTALLIVSFLINKLRHKKFSKKILRLNSTEEKFTWIYKNKYWTCNESVSGTGSTLKYTENLRSRLPLLLEKYSISTVFDAPCGDFNWMKHFLKNVDIKYIGGDIVKPLIENLNNLYSTKSISFIHIDLTKDVPPKSDLMICRDCLIHLSYEDTKLLLANFIKSETNYLLTTTHVNSNRYFTNKDILTGDYRQIDLFSHPYNFPSNPLFTIEDWLLPDPQRIMCLWSKEQIIQTLNKK